LLQAAAYARRVKARANANDGIYALWSCDGQDYLSRVRDVSAGGLFIETPLPTNLGAEVKVHFLVGEGRIAAAGVVRHVKPGQGLGLKFTSLNDQDSQCFAALMKRLRN
jgi:hypothetical protein